MLKYGIVISAILVNACVTRSQQSSQDQIDSRMKNSGRLSLPTESLLPTLSRAKSLRVDDYKDHPDVQRWIEYYSIQHKGEFQAILKRGQPYKKQIHAILEKFELPKDLYYLACIESHFRIHALSTAKAMGFWQFMEPTARSFGLQINSYTDERKDPWRSTVAAAIYLKSLNNVFDSWFLAMSAYNAGQSRIMNAIMNSGTRDYWELSKLGFIPRETRNYIPRFLAAVIIGKNPTRYGIQVEGDYLPQMVAVQVPSPVNLSDIASLTDLSVEELKAYNPHLLHQITPPHMSSYRIWLPEHSTPKQAEVAQLSPVTVSDARRSSKK